MYQPFPIYDFRSGLQFDREPWLTPHQAFQISNNVYFQNGRVYKRKGYASFGNGCAPILQVSATGDDADKRNAVFASNRITLFSGKAGAACHAAVRFDNIYIPQGTTISAAYLRFYIEDFHGSPSLVCYGIDEDDTASLATDPFSRTKTTASADFSRDQWDEPAEGAFRATPSITTIVQEILDRPGWTEGNAMGFLIEDNGSLGDDMGFAGDVPGFDFDAPGFSNYISFVAYDGSTTNCAKLVIQLETLYAPPVMGIYNFYTVGGASDLIGFDTDYMYVYNETTETWEGVGGFSTLTPDFTGDDADFFWTELIPQGQLSAATDKMLICNNVDNIYVWDGTTLQNATADGWDGTEPDACLFLIVHKNRIIALNTLESGARYPQRFRCSNVGDYTDWSDDIYGDADTVDWITGVVFVRGEPLVFFERSIWWLRYTGDATTPFVWKKIDETEGSYAPYSVVNFEGEGICLGPTSFVGSDGLRSYAIDERIPDLILTMNQSALQYAYGFLAEELRQYLCSYPSAGASHCDKVAVLNYVDDSWTLFDMPLHVAGYWSTGSDWTFDGTSVTMDEMDWTFDERTLQAGYPVTIIGDYEGYTYTLFSGSDDNGTAIPTQLKTKRLVPFEGQKARLGWIDLIGDSDSNLSFTIKVYKDYRTTPCKTRTVTMYEANKEKTRQRVRVMENGEHFEIEIIDSNTSNDWALDAIVPFFQEAGRKK